MRVERHVHVELGVGLGRVARVRRVVLNQVPDAPADLPPADVSHRLLDRDARGAGIDVVGPRKLHPGARVGRARDAHGNFGGCLRHHLRRELAAVQHVIGDTGPLVVAHPAFRRRPDLVATVVGPARLHIVLLRRQNFALQLAVDEEELLIAQLELDRATSDVGRDHQADDPVREAIDVPTFVLRLFELRLRGSCGRCHGPPRQ